MDTSLKRSHINLPGSLAPTGTAKERLLEEGYDPDFGARPMKRVFQKRIQDILAMEMLKGSIKAGNPGEPETYAHLKIDYDSKRECMVIA